MKSNLILNQVKRFHLIPVRLASDRGILALVTSSALPYGTDSDGLGAIFLGAIFKMAEVNRATRGVVCATGIIGPVCT